MRRSDRFDPSAEHRQRGGLEAPVHAEVRDRRGISTLLLSRLMFPQAPRDRAEALLDTARRHAAGTYDSEPRVSLH